MKKILILLLGFSSSALALDENPIAPPRAEIVDKFGVNLQTGQLSRKLNTVSIGGKLGLSHYVNLYTDFLSAGNNGFVDAFAGSVTSRKISSNVVQILTNANNDITAIRDTGTYQPAFIPVRVMRAYGPAGSQDFLVYQNGIVNNDTSATTGYIYRPVGDTRHSLTESPDKKYLTWITPDGTETKYERSVMFAENWNAGSGAQLREVTYPNGFKVRVKSTDVTTNTGFMLKYQLQTLSRLNTFDQMVAINLAYQYCASNAATCSTAGWPTATFTWPDGTPSVFRQSGLPLSSYLIKMTTGIGVTDIQYQPENVCIKEGGSEDANCAANPPGGTKWYPRLRSIRTPESNVPNYQYTYKNVGAFSGEDTIYRVKDKNGMDIDSGLASTYTYWSLLATSGQIIGAALNGTDSQSYSTSVNSYNANVTWGNRDTWVVSSLYDFDVIESVINKKSGTYSYLKDSRHLVEFYYPIGGLGPKQHYYYAGPRGNLTSIMAVDASGNETRLQEASYTAGCTYPKTCNKPISTTDAKGNVTNYDYDPQGRFSSPIKITGPANKKGLRSSTFYNYVPMYASYKKDSEAITQDPDPIWMLKSEYTCLNSPGCTAPGTGAVLTEYEYSRDNLLLTGIAVTAEEATGGLMTKRTCYQYDKYGNRIGETQPNGNAGRTSCNP